MDKKVKQKLGYAKKNWPKNIAKYNEQEQQMAISERPPRDMYRPSIATGPKIVKAAQ